MQYINKVHAPGRSKTEQYGNPSSKLNSILAFGYFDKAKPLQLERIFRYLSAGYIVNTQQSPPAIDTRPVHPRCWQLCVKYEWSKLEAVFALIFILEELNY